MSYIEAIEYATPTQRELHAKARERRELRGVPDEGIDLWRGRSHGITGYEWQKRIEAARQARIKAEQERASQEPKPEPVFVHPPGIHVCHFVQTVVATYFGMTVTDLLNHNRTHRYVYPRHMAMYICRMKYHITFPEIGRRFKRDHTCALNSIGRINDRCAVDADFKAALDRVWELCGS